MRSGGVVIGGGRTRLVAYRYVAGTNDAVGRAPGAARIRRRRRSGSSGTRRCLGPGPYPVRLVLDLETTYDDGTVRTTQVSGTVGVTVVYSAVSQ